MAEAQAVSMVVIVVEVVTLVAVVFAVAFVTETASNHNPSVIVPEYLVSIHSYPPLEVDIAVETDMMIEQVVVLEVLL